jgi:hypothetical protein
MAAPMVVPRPVVTASMARTSGSRSVVGATATCAKPENSTRPIRVLGSCVWTKSRTAACAAVSRLGSTSVAHMEPDTSTARISATLEYRTACLRRRRSRHT